MMGIVFRGYREGYVRDDAATDTTKLINRGAIELESIRKMVRLKWQP
jgi:hypothetical protein